MDSVSLSAFLARRVLQEMVVSFPKDATQTRGTDKLTRKALPWRPADSVAAIVKGTTIDGALRLAAKRHESAESINLTWTKYRSARALSQVLSTAFWVVRQIMTTRCCITHREYVWLNVEAL